MVPTSESIPSNVVAATTTQSTTTTKLAESHLGQCHTGKFHSESGLESQVLKANFPTWHVFSKKCLVFEISFCKTGPTLSS